MKIRKSKLRQIVKEEIASMLAEAPGDRLRGGASDEILDMPLGLASKPAREVPKAGRRLPADVKARIGRRGRHEDLLRIFKQLEKQLQTMMSTGHGQKDRKANIFDLKAAMKRTAHQIKTHDPQFEMPAWINDPTWEGFRSIEKIPGMLDKVPTQQELAAIADNVSEMYGNADRLEEISAYGMPQLPKHLSDAYKKAARVVIDQMISNQDYPQ